MNSYNRGSFMPLPRISFLLAGTFAAAAVLAQPAPLSCPPVAGRPCDAYHFHIQLYRPDTRQFVEVYGVNQFATQGACDRARELHIATNSKVVDYLRAIKSNYEADRVGPCHCDMTGDKASPNYLTPEQRTGQLRAMEEIRLRVRERLLDNKLTGDSEIVRALWSEPPLTPQLGAPKLTRLPRTAPAPVLTAVEELRATKTIDTTKPVPAAMELPLIDIAAAMAAAAAPAAPAAINELPAPSIAEAAPNVPASATPPAMPPVEEVVVDAPQAAVEPAVESEIASTVPEVDVLSAEETAERFISYETDRILNIIRAAAAITDDEVKPKITDAATQRIQLLSNLRLLIEGSGMRSRLAAAARDAETEGDRLALVGRLFGESIEPHWAPRDAADVIFEVEPAIAADPERALRDTTGRVSVDQKKRALYLMLAKTQPTQDQLLWLTTIVEEFLK